MSPIRSINLGAIYHILNHISNKVHKLGSHILYPESISREVHKLGSHIPYPTSYLQRKAIYIYIYIIYPTVNPQEGLWTIINPLKGYSALKARKSKLSTWRGRGAPCSRRQTSSGFGFDLSGLGLEGSLTVGSVCMSALQIWIYV